MGAVGRQTGVRVLRRRNQGVASFSPGLVAFRTPERSPIREERTSEDFRALLMKNLNISDDGAGKWKLSLECEIFIALVRSV
jgi:hypothetical protein